MQVEIDKSNYKLLDTFMERWYCEIKESGKHCCDMKNGVDKKHNEEGKQVKKQNSGRYKNGVQKCDSFTQKITEFTQNVLIKHRQ